MLGGYNCTIFAYGQTGTGKTYTMSGDMADHCGGIPPATAGIIPRALARIFQVLDQAGDEYAVKCSFIELYNEELRDLLSLQEDQKVKIFDDSTKKGAIIMSGMEELAVNDATHGVRILQDGSRKREVASTKCNEVSSRSHSVFTITVHIKQTSTDGEDMMRVGKLNLVDLAGSENVGRSGAENKRAREAGMINQSLLTLGRVINALVDRSQHVPYRESKLTRLLQDSLGGRTKTCIIVTLSPAMINMDETVSTLDYANRAKSIKNKPQVNQMMTKKALIKDFIKEIERLKGDLNSTRTKTGVYMTEESHLDLVNQNESNKLLTEEQQRKIDAMDIQIQRAKEHFEQTTAAYNETKRELESTLRALIETKENLAHTESSLAQETLLRKEHQKSEADLDAVAKSLRSTLHDVVGDVNGLHAKIDRKVDLERTNRHAWTAIGQDVLSITTAVDTSIEKFSQAQLIRSAVFSERITTSLDKEMKLFSDEHRYLDNQMQEFLERKANIDSGLAGSHREMDDVLDQIKVLREEVKSRLGSGLQNLSRAAQEIAGRIKDQMGDFQKDIHQSYTDLASEFKQNLGRTEQHIAAQSAKIQKLKEDLHSTSTRNVAAIAKIFKQLAEAQERNAQSLKEEESLVLLQVQKLLGNLSRKRCNHTEKTNEIVSQQIQAAVADIQDQDTKNLSAIDFWQNAEGVFRGMLSKDKDTIKSLIVRSWDSAKTKVEIIQESTADMQEESVQLVDAAMQNVDSQTQALDQFVTRAKTLNENHHRSHREAISSLLLHNQRTQQSVQRGLHKARTELESCRKSILANAQDEKNAVSALHPQIVSQSEKIRKRTATIMEDDVPTHATPKKREYIYPTCWRTTRRHSELLNEHHELLSAEQQIDRNPLSDVDVNVTSPTLAQIDVGGIEDDLALPLSRSVTSHIPAPKSRVSVEKETSKPMLATGQENGFRPIRTRKRLIG